MDLDDVPLSDDDGERVDRIHKGTSFTKKQAEAIVRFSKVERDDRDPSQVRRYVKNGHDPKGSSGDNGIDDAECARIRRAMDRADRPTTVISAYPNKHPSAIFRHATGRCDHAIDTAPTTSPRILSDECREMRTDFQTGDTVEDIRSTYNRSANAVVKHVFGRCDHTFDTDRNGRELSGSLCARMRRTYRENDSASIADIGAAFLVGASTAHRHVTGGCRHADDVEAPVDGDSARPIDEDECGAFRSEYEDGATPDRIADSYGRDATAVRKHVFGRCRHGISPYSPDRQAVGPTRCKAIRHEYRTRGVASVASIIDRLRVSKGTFYFHLTGECSHDHDVDPVDPNA
jgi:hypothetical protein